MRGIPSYLTPGIGNRFPDWVRILRWGGQPLSARYLHRVGIVGAINLLSGPFQVYERLRLRRQLDRTAIHPAPVFIIGHWRSGTTLLHNLLCQDPRFGYVSTVQSLFPHSFLTNPLFPWLTKVLMPATRPMDSMRLFLDSPQEEEMAMVNYGPWSFYHAWHFPRALRYYYHRLVRMEGLSAAELEAWRQAYTNLLATATLAAKGRRLVLKNPAHTARIPELLRLFPEARFVFLHRDPLAVYPSTQKLYRNVVPVFQLQRFDAAALDRDIVYIYKDLLTTYRRDRERIAPERRAEVLFSELARDPQAEVERLYGELDLGPFAEAAPAIEAYLGQRRLKTFRPAQYDLPAETQAMLKREWAFAWETWGAG